MAEMQLRLILLVLIAHCASSIVIYVATGSIVNDARSDVACANTACPNHTIFCAIAAEVNTMLLGLIVLFLLLM